jgi:PPOX class probable F420-dependent enzyme
MMPDAVREVIESGKLAHLTTINSDGSPLVTIAWVGADDDDIVIGTLPEQRKLQNMRREPRVALSIETGRMSEHGLPEYLVVYGRATVTAGGAPELLQRLARVYIGPDVKFPPMQDPPSGFVTRIKPDRYGGLGPWSD